MTTRLLLLTVCCTLPHCVLAFPTSLNYIPSADHMERGTVRVELELDGYPTPFSNDPSLQVYTQVGVTDRFEVGLDWVDVNADDDVQFNAKWQVTPESERYPAIAIGLMDVTDRGPLANWYVVASKAAGEDFRLHAGLFDDDATRGMVGVEYYLSDRSELIADWTTGPWAYATVGYWHDLGDGVAALLYYGRCNTRDEKADFVGLNAYWEGAW
ncbi:MAG: YjbH domain-containing protein [Armatimonadetes bacterium]|nr:YjbH domain-containing protein [Armatimonadota bacterium]